MQIWLHQDDASGGGLVNLSLVEQIKPHAYMKYRDGKRIDGESDYDLIATLPGDGSIQLIRQVGDKKAAELCVDMIADLIREIATGQRSDPIIDAAEVQIRAASSFPVGRTA